jgi:hypothetical protein
MFLDQKMFWPGQGAVIRKILGTTPEVGTVIFLRHEEKLM